MRRWFVLVSSTLVVVLLSHAGYGQGGASASLSGVVLDPSGAVIPGAQVTVKNDATSADFHTVTVENGTFLIPALSAGRYTATINARGFKQGIYKDIQIDPGVPATLRAVHQVGDSAETAVVVAAGEIVQSSSATMEQTVSKEQVTNLPLVSRNFLDFLVFLPGVNTTTTNRLSTFKGCPTTRSTSRSMASTHRIITSRATEAETVFSA